MAVTSLNVVTGSSFTSLASGTFNPTAGGLLLAHLGIRGLSTVQVGTLSDDIGGTGWTAIHNPAEYIQTTNYRRVMSFWKLVPESPGTGRTVTWTPSESITEGVMEIAQYTGDMNTSAPILQVADNYQTSGDFVVTLPSTSLSGNTVVGVLYHRNMPDVAPDAGYTQLSLTTHDTSDYLQSQYATTVQTASTWTNIVNTNGIGLAYEIDSEVIVSANSNGIVGLLSGF
jgi:hypothetical protein